MKTRKLGTVLALAGSTLFFISCNDGINNVEDSFAIAEAEKSVESVVAPGDSCTFTGTLTEGEIEGLMKMREEEKLAQDVYTTLYGIYGHIVFSNIAKSESAHTSAVLHLINGYGLEDPALTGIGQFSNPLFADLYVQLTDKGSGNLVKALKIGAFIEEYDIADLRRLLEETQNTDVQRVYGHLLGGSENHIRAFTNALTQQGSIYTPTIITAEEYEEILNTTED